jgi:hypothetical protein
MNTRKKNSLEPCNIGKRYLERIIFPVESFPHLEVKRAQTGQALQPVEEGGTLPSIAAFGVVEAWAWRRKTRARENERGSSRKVGVFSQGEDRWDGIHLKLPGMP